VKVTFNTGLDRPFNTGGGKKNLGRKSFYRRERKKGKSRKSAGVRRRKRST